MAWTLTYDGYDPAKQGLREALCALGNGFFATRGAEEDADADEAHYPGTYLAGGYDRLVTRVVDRDVENEDLVNMPNWLGLRFRIAGGEWFHVDRAKLLSYQKRLDLRRGVLERIVRAQDAEGRTFHVSSRRFVSMDDPHLAGIEVVLRSEGWSGRVEFESALDARVVNAGVKRYGQLDGRHLMPLFSRVTEEGAIAVGVETKQSGLRVALAARTTCEAVGGPPAGAPVATTQPGFAAQGFAVDVKPGQEVRASKVVCVYTSRDRAISECGFAARAAIADAAPFGELLERHVRAWGRLWERFDLELGDHDGRSQPDAPALRVLRLHTFHLLQTTGPGGADLDVGAPARGLHGEAYRGHVFWDELFIFPLVNLRFPEVTRGLLLYRYRRLGAARALARQAGHRGAMYPWQSGSDGREESQLVHLNPRSGRWIPDHSSLQRHVSSAVGYNVWQYYRVTRDREFLSAFGAEMILEIARFWASAAAFNEAEARYEIRGVMGPDEYHEAYPDASQPGLDNNAYTNLLAVWILERALAVLRELPEDRRRELVERLEIQPVELQRWEDISRRMKVCFHDGDIISQFQGYEHLAELDWGAYRKKYGNIGRLDRILESEGDSPNRYKLSKQADVLMLFYLFSHEELRGLLARLGYEFGPDAIGRNIEYYLARASHGSTLSYIVHAWVLARYDPARSWREFQTALRSDVDDIQGGTTHEGIHLGSMSGTVDLMQRGYTGLEIREGVLRFDPCLPLEVGSLRFRIHYLGHPIEVLASQRVLTLRAGRGPHASLPVAVRAESAQLRPGEEISFAL